MSVADDEVIEHANVHERERVFQAARDELVRLAGLEYARRMVVSQDHRRSVVQQCLPQYLARMDAGTIDGAAEQLFERDQAVAVVEVQATYLYL